MAPCNGRVVSVRYDATGKFELAYNETKSRENEKAIITLDTNIGIVKVYQIAGKLVRCIDTYNKEGDRVVSGNLIGMIKLGSRVDLILPNASHFQLKVKEGIRVNGSSTIIGSYDNQY